METEVRDEYKKAQAQYESRRVLELLSGEADGLDAFVDIHAGAGGTESEDWASMLLRMYTRWAERRKFKVEVVDLLEAEGGVKSATLQISGQHAYGFLKSEHGVHRMVQHQSLRLGRAEAYQFHVGGHPPRRRRYHRGRHQDRRPAHRHVPCPRRGRTARQQDRLGRTHHPYAHGHRGPVPERAVAAQEQGHRHEHAQEPSVRVLQGRARHKEMAKYSADKKAIESGARRSCSYVFQPYTMVKDHRTKHETSQVQNVMDGDIDGFIEDYLRSAWENTLASPGGDDEL